MEDEDETISRIITELETIQNLNEPDPKTPISESTLSDLQTLFDATPDPDPIWAHLSSINLSSSSLTRLLTLTMESGSTRVSFLASKLYLSILLSPNSPVLTLFTPMAFLSLLRSIRQFLKHQPAPMPARTDSNPKRKGGKRVSRNSDDGVESRESEFDLGDLYPVLEKLDMVLGLIHLDRFPDSLKSLIETVVQIPVMGVELSRGASSFNKLSGLCSRILSEILRSEHGDQLFSAPEVLKALSQPILTTKSPARTFALGFVSNQMMGMSKNSDLIRKAIGNFPKYLSQKAPEKSEPRALAVDSIMEVVRGMEFEDQVGFVDYVLKLALGKAQFRLLAVDIIPMLMMSLRDPFLGVNSETGVENSWGLRCLEALIQRCSDVVAGIRARALSSFAQLVGHFSSDSRNRAALKEVMGFGNMGCVSSEGGINDLLRKRCVDEKAAVRKAALLLVTKLTSLLDGAVDEEVLKTMGMACLDPLVSIRKAAISALSEAFRTFSDRSVTTEWLHSVPRLIADNETSIQEECENLFLELVVERVSRAGSSVAHHKEDRSRDSNVKPMSIDKELELLFPEGVLGLLKEICNGEVTPWVKKLCMSLGKKKRLKPKIANALQNVIQTSESLWLTHSMPIEKWTAPPGAWFLLSEVSGFLSASVKWDFLHHHWKLLDECKLGESRGPPPPLEVSMDDEVAGTEYDSVAWAGDRVFLLKTISNVSSNLPAEPAAELGHNLLKRLEEFNMNLTEVNAHVKALRTLCKRQASDPDEADVLVMKWVHQLLAKASKILEKYISKDSDANKGISFLTPPRSMGRKGKNGAAMTKLLSRAITAVYTIGSVVIICPTADLSIIVPILHTIITSSNPDPKLKKLAGSTVSIKETAPSLYIQAWVTMGKVCLADDKLAKRYIPLFVQELEKSDIAALRNNIVVVMADFCVRYTALVDCYISRITKCLRDSCEVVRRQTFLLLSRLLQRDYVKWRGVLFLRFLLSLVDESEKIRQLADFLFGNILKAKAPLLAYNSFVEAVLVLNDCSIHHGHSDSQASRSESRIFSLRGNNEKWRSKRMHIYICLLKQMAPEQLLATFAKLCAEILAAVSDGMLNIDEITAQSVLQDTFQILSCKEIRNTSSRGSSESAEMDDDGGDTGGAATAAARGRVITQAVKKSLIQNSIPIFIELKRLLESKNSPLIGALMECLRALLKDYKNEIDDLLVADKQLQKELIYDMQKYEGAKAKTTVNKPGSCSEEEADVTKSAKAASAKADAAAAATARSVLREVNHGAATPPLSTMGMPKVKSGVGGATAQGDRPVAVLESLRRRQSFNSDDEN